MSNQEFATKSMTAFAKQQINSEDQTGTNTLGRFSWEIKSVNQRYLEINPRLPDAYRHLEIELRNRIKKTIHRGKLDISLSVENNAENLSFSINQNLLSALNKAVSEVQMQLPEATHVNPLEVLQWPGVLQQEMNSSEQQANDEIILSALDETLQLLDQQRLREGKALGLLIMERVNSIGDKLDQLQPQLPGILQRHIDKLKQRIVDLSEQLDEQRFHQEVAILAQKVDIAEEIDRIRTHLVEVEHNLSTEMLHKPVGRKLDFLMQELNREANTLGSKSIDQQISKTSVELKVLIEQMREQVQNIE